MGQAVFDSFICAKPGDCHIMCPDCYLNDSTPKLRKLNVFPALEENVSTVNSFAHSVGEGA